MFRAFKEGFGLVLGGAIALFIIGISMEACGVSLNDKEDKENAKS